MGCGFFLQEIFPTQGLNSVSCIAGGFFTAEPWGKPQGMQVPDPKGEWGEAPAPASNKPRPLWRIAGRCFLTPRPGPLECRLLSPALPGGMGHGPQRWLPRATAILTTTLRPPCSVPWAIALGPINQCIVETFRARTSLSWKGREKARDQLLGLCV